jgi:hypothetical protein
MLQLRGLYNTERRYKINVKTLVTADSHLNLYYQKMRPELEDKNKKN